MINKYFIFKRGAKQPEGQIVYGDDHVSGSGKSTLNEIFKIKLKNGDYDNLSLDELILKFKDKVK